MNNTHNKKYLRSLMISSILTLLVSCGGGGSGPDPAIQPPPPPSDTIPDTFTFTDQTDIAFDTLIQSNSITISGIDTASTISITGGEYSINTGAFVGTEGTVSNGQIIVVQQTSSSSSNTTTNVVLTIGGVSDTFSVTTVLVLNADFVEKIEAITLNQIKLFSGNVDVDNGDTEDLDVDNLNSGDLITIGIDYDLADGVADYSVTAQLIPQSIINQLESGTTLGEIVKNNYVADEGEEIIDLGGVYVGTISDNNVFAVLKTKLPALAQDIKYQIMVTPEISFLASGGSTQQEELALIPVLIDDRTLTVAQLESPKVTIIEPPALIDENDFTSLDISGTFDANGFSSKPIFQTSVAVDLTSFNTSESIELSMTWQTSKGDIFELGLVSSDDSDQPIVNEKAVFQIARNGGTNTIVPVVAYVSEAAHAEMLTFATEIKDIADQVPESGQFILDINIIENGVIVATAASYGFDLPLVRQDLSALVLETSDIINYTVLRAGSSNSACLRIFTDIDTGFVETNSISPINASTCAETPPNETLWLFDFSTNQIINKATDVNGDNYCITAFGSGFFPNSYQLQKCEFKNSQPSIAIDSQRFEHDGEKILMQIAPIYLAVDFDGGLNKSVFLTTDTEVAPNFFRDSDGYSLDNQGRVFTVGDGDNFGLGDSSSFKISLSYEGTTKVDYNPVIGITNTGHINLNMDLLGINIDLADGRFTHKKYLSKQISSVSGYIRPVEVGNGAEVEYTLLGLTSTLGEIETTTISESYNPLENIATVLSDEAPINELANLELGKRDFDEELFSITYVVVAFPITISGQVSGDIHFEGSLNSQGIGLNTSIDSIISLSASITGELDAFVASGGVEATLELINKTLSFKSGGQFTVSTSPLPDKLQFEANSDLDITLKLLKGEVIAFVEYPRVCLCLDAGETVRKEKSLYSSGYLFNGSSKVFEGRVTATIIDI